MKSFCLGAATVLGLTLAGSVLADDVRMLAIEPNVPEGRQYYLDVAKAYEAANPGTKVQFDFLDDTSFKSKLPTLLQSSARPDAFFTWTGGVFYEQAKAGVLKDISADFTDADRKNYSPSGIQSMSHDGKLYGVPMYAASVVLWYNKALVEKAGVDPRRSRTGKTCLPLPRKSRARHRADRHGRQGQVADRSLLRPACCPYRRHRWRRSRRQGRKRRLQQSGLCSGWRSREAAGRYKAVPAGYMDTTQPKAAGLFGDGKGAFYLAGNFLVGAQAQNSASGKGLGDDLDFITFPSVDGGKGDPADTFGGVNGWLVTKDAGKSTVDFLKIPDQQQEPDGRRPPEDLVTDRHRRPVRHCRSAPAPIAEGLSKAPHHQLYLDQMLGASVGAALNRRRSTDRHRRHLPGRGCSPGGRSTRNALIPCLKVGVAMHSPRLTQHRNISRNDMTTMTGSRPQLSPAARIARMHRQGKLTALLLFLRRPWCCSPFSSSGRSFNAANLSFFKWSGYGAIDNFVGTQNYQRLANHSVFHQSLWNSVKLILASLFIQIPLALMLALLIYKKTSINTAFRLIFFAPYILAEIASGVIWSFIFDGDFGVSGQIATALGIEPFYILADRQFAFLAIITVVVWKYFGYHMMIFIAALQAVPDDLIEAAEIDGAGRWQKVFYVKLPLIMHAIKLSAFLRNRWRAAGLRHHHSAHQWRPVELHPFDRQLFYTYGLAQLNVGYGAAVGVVLFILCMVTAFSYRRLAMGKGGAL